MELAGLIEQYGYAAVFAGSVLEGETLLALAGVAAHRGYLSLHWVIAVAVAGAFLGDQLCFLAGRFFGGRMLARWPRLEPSVARADALLARRGATLVIGLRFMYGLRLAGVLAIGMSRMRWRRFAILNLIGALLWAPLVAGAGYLLGNAVERLLGHVQLAEYTVIAAALIAGVAVWIIHQRRKRVTTRST
jgi:membrane protein DedA with SNARE-associated domain